ncbi:MAG: glycoside hydrolase family 127 protein [Chitinispirillaceae bacterium]|nr:glycoside hydrolase family 127 protein [Chitinispirillaceae bacterium]
MRRGQVLTLLVMAIGFSAIVTAQDKLYKNTFPLGDVTLLEGPFKHAVEENAEHLKKYTVDRLLFPFRKESGLSTQGARNYVNWEGLDGHVGGHYLTALAMQYAATGDAECKTRMDYMVDELKKCQDANGNDQTFVGYVSGIPGGKAMWREYRTGNFGSYSNLWVPWYNIHKIYAGLRDAWAYGGNETAKTMFLALCDWGLGINSGLSDSQLQSMMSVGLKEQGSINEMYADAYYITNNEKYLNFAKKFSHKWILDPMASGRDMLDNNHANAQAAKGVGFQRIGEVGDDDYYHRAADFFWETVVTKKSIAIGGNSEDEYFKSPNAWMEFIQERNGVETCNTYNMLKITEGLFRQNPDAKYADFYERALYNHILSTQHPDHGGYVYFTPTHPGHYRVYSAPDVAMWCCVGSGMENHNKYGEFIYTHTDDALYVNLFIASELDWKDKGITIRQETEFPDEEMSVLTVGVDAPTQFKLRIRHPYWATRGGMVVFAGGDTIGLDSEPSSYIEVERTWNDGDVVTIVMKMNWAIEPLNNVPSWIAIRRGPIVMGAKTSSNDMPGLIAGDARFGHSPGGTLPDPNSAPKLRINGATFGNEFTQVDNEPMRYRAPGIFQNSANGNMVFEPFFRIHDSRYIMYWNATVNGDIVEARVLPEKKQPADLRIRRMNGKTLFLFASVDPSRRVLLYNFSGRKVADIAASAKSVELHYGNERIGLSNGMYTMEIVSQGRRFSEKLCVSK